MTLLFIRGSLDVLLDLDSVGITEKGGRGLHGSVDSCGSDLAASPGEALLCVDEFAPRLGLWSVDPLCENYLRVMFPLPTNLT